MPIMVSTSIVWGESACWYGRVSPFLVSDVLLNHQGINLNNKLYFNSNTSGVVSSVLVNLRPALTVCPHRPRTLRLPSRPPAISAYIARRRYMVHRSQSLNRPPNNPGKLTSARALARNPGPVPVRHKISQRKRHARRRTFAGYVALRWR